MPRLFFLFSLLTLLSSSVSAQTLFHEKEGVILHTTPALLVVPTNAFGYNLNASYSHRLSGQFDVTGSLGYSRTSAVLGASMGYTHRLSEADWGFRAVMALTTLTSLEGGHPFSGRGRLSTMFFKEVGLFSFAQTFPNVNIATDVLLRDRRPEVALSASVGVPVYFRIWREVRLFASPSYGVGLLPNLHRGYMSIGFGAQVSFTR